MANGEIENGSGKTDTLNIDFMLEFCEKAADTVHNCLDQALSSARMDGNHYSAVAYFMAKEDFYRWEVPSLIKSMAEEAKKREAAF